MRKLLVFKILFSLILASDALSAQAALITFNDGPSGVVLTDYAGYTWDTNMLDYYGGYRGAFYLTASSSGPYDDLHYVFNYYGGINMGFTSSTYIYSIDGWFSYFETTNPVALRIAGYNDGRLVGASPYVTLASIGQDISATFMGATRIVFETLEPGWYKMDQLNINNPSPVPIPSTILLLGPGLIGLLGMNRKFRKR